MSEIEIFLKSISDGLRSLAKGIDAVAEKVNTVATVQGETETPRKPGRPRTRTPRKKPARRGAPPGQKIPAYEMVYEIIAESNGIGTGELRDRTGFDGKKVHNIIYKLKKLERIKNKAKGIYIKA